jgi:hypothetical protein
VFTQDFFTLIKSRLNEGGIYGQWVNLFHMDATTLKSLLRAFYEVFPQGMTFANLSSGDFIMYGSAEPIFFDYEQINQRLNEPRIKEALAYHEIYSARDLLWYFALSREQALAAAMDVPANTDTNILSEVRLSALNKDLPPEEDPYEFLRNTYTFNVWPYFENAEVADRVYELGTYYLSEWDDLDIAKHTADQLEAADAVRARGLRYEKLWHQFDFEAAADLYAQHEQWPDRTHVQQALLLADQQRFQEALAIVDRVQFEDLRRTLFARLLYEQERFDELAALHPQAEAERLWQLTAVARKDLMTAGAALHELVQTVDPALPQLQVLAGYYSAIHDEAQLKQVARRIIQLEDRQVNRITGLIEEAVQDGKAARAAQLLRRLDRYHPEENYDLKLLRTKVARLQQKGDAA